MSSDAVISVRVLCKRFKVYKDPWGRVIEWVKGRLVSLPELGTGFHPEVFALFAHLEPTAFAWTRRGVSA